MVPARIEIEMDDACAILDPFLPRCVDILLDFMDKVNSPQMASLRGSMGRRTFCSLLADDFYSQMEQAPEHGVRFERRQDKGQHFIVFQDLLALRVKQIGRQYLSWNLPTTHSLRWNLGLPSPEIGPLPTLELGYHLDALMNGYRGIHLLQRFEKVVDWRQQIYGVQTDAFDTEQPRLHGLGGSRKVYRYRPIR